MMTTKVEFSCEMNFEKSKENVENTLKEIKNLKIVLIDAPSSRVVVEISDKCPATIMDLQDRIETDAGVKTVVRGVGNKFTGVSEIFGPSNLIGVVRMAEIDTGKCYVDGLVDNVRIASDNHCSLNIHEYGDFRGDHFENVGNVRVAMMSNVKPDKRRCAFKGYVNNCDVQSLIGRSIIISEQESGLRLGGGIIARSSSIFENVKKICECSGKSLWNEREEHKMS